MVPKISRRAALSALATASIPAVAGCTGGTNGDNDTTRTTPEHSTTKATETTQTTADGDRSINPASSPLVAVRSAFRAETVNGFQSRFHPLHPFSIKRMSRENAKALYKNASQLTSVRRVNREVTVDLVVSATLPGSGVNRSAIEDALADAETSVVEATAETDSGTQTVEFVTIKRDGGWLILAQGLPAPSENDSGALSAWVVEDITFDRAAGVANVQFVDHVIAESVTVEAVQSGSSKTTDTPESVTTLNVDVASGGDEVVVSATLEGERRIVHRERYPERDRLVDDVEFVMQPKTDARNAIARVNFNDVDMDGRVRVASTVKGGSTEVGPAKSLDYLVVGVDPDGDEVVVTYPAGGNAEEVHRERWRS
ncbi:hypothetical protein [Salarchaeum sp. JOR-1]|uniref:hypothetical protein n=1 Tax=Salarchaeum sp. JOR-1 TaxID=2599399 RepID=UPI0011988ADE|nr:hypothetical protein [Salarchaeum sp. JOR-1]QDX41770.1 hypothetical protein FQU85_12960 [Salarchaeum sp. JOR-1]